MLCYYAIFEIQDFSRCHVFQQDGVLPNCVNYMKMYLISVLQGVRFESVNQQLHVQSGRTRTHQSYMYGAT